MTKKPPADAVRRLLNYDYAAAYLGISVRTMKQLAAAGEVPKVPLNSNVRFDVADLDDYVERIKRAAS